MRQKRSLETDEHRNERQERKAQERVRLACEEDKALDAAVKRSIRQHGP
jgi:hypothetical protein